MRLTVESAVKRLVLELPAREDEVEPIAGGMRFPLAFLAGATVRIDCQPGDPGVIAIQPLTKPRTGVQASK